MPRTNAEFEAAIELRQSEILNTYSNAELHARCKEHGLDCGPIRSDADRKVCAKRLAQKLEEKNKAESDKILTDFFRQLLKKYDTQPNSPGGSTPAGASGPPQDNTRPRLRTPLKELNKNTPNTDNNIPSINLITPEPPQQPKFTKPKKPEKIELKGTEGLYLPAINIISTAETKNMITEKLFKGQYRYICR